MCVEHRAKKATYWPPTLYFMYYMYFKHGNPLLRGSFVIMNHNFCVYTLNLVLNLVVPLKTLNHSKHLSCASFISQDSVNSVLERFKL